MCNKIYRFYLDLLNKHGDPIALWPQWCAKDKDDKLKDLIAIGAILTQRTSWRNVDFALKNLKKNNLLSLKAIASLKNLDFLTELTKPAGFFQTKPKRLYTLARFIIDNYGSLTNFANKESLPSCREKLLNLYGIGPETADTISLYALGKTTFIIDEYTKRLTVRKKFCRNLKYDDLKKFFEDNLPKSVEIYQNLHALIIIEQRGRELSAMNKV